MASLHSLLVWPLPTFTLPSYVPSLRSRPAHSIELMFFPSLFCSAPKPSRCLAESCSGSPTGMRYLPRSVDLSAPFCPSPYTERRTNQLRRYCPFLPRSDLWHSRFPPRIDQRLRFVLLLSSSSPLFFLLHPLLFLLSSPSLIDLPLSTPCLLSRTVRSSSHSFRSLEIRPAQAPPDLPTPLRLHPLRVVPPRQQLEQRAVHHPDKG
jgi:hypothetical protein